jgi:hypothetical protein
MSTEPTGARATEAFAGSFTALVTPFRYGLLRERLPQNGRGPRCLSMRAEPRESPNYSPASAANVSMTAVFGSRFDGRPYRSFKCSRLLYDSLTFP